MSGSDDAYMRLIASLWSAGEDFLIIEHDVVPNRTALLQAERCSCLWATSPYNGPGLDPIYHSLGFVRFRAELMRREPDLMSQVATLDDAIDTTPGHWRSLDARIDGTLRQRGYEPHIHAPVIQHHVYRGVCACMTEHEEFPVDAEGRYLPEE